jgi:hypothetical protein
MFSTKLPCFLFPTYFMQFLLYNVVMYYIKFCVVMIFSIVLKIASELFMKHSFLIYYNIRVTSVHCYGWLVD